MQTLEGRTTFVASSKEELRSLLATKHSLHHPRRAFHTGLNTLDALAPGGSFQSRAVHELLWPTQSMMPTSIALLLAKVAQQDGGAIAWTDPERELYLPAISAAGVDLRHLILLRCSTHADQLRSLVECLRCPGVSATVAVIERLSQIEARRLQLAAERGGGVGLFMRPYSPKVCAPYAAATRWLIQPIAGDRNVQRWSVELLHGQGGQVGKVLLLEVDRETRAVRASSQLAYRQAAAATARATA